MNLDQTTLRAIFGTPSAAASWTLPLGPGSWRVLLSGKARSLLVPEGAAEARRLLHFVRPWQALYARLMLKLDSAFPQSRLLREFRADGGHGFFLDRQVYGNAARALIQVGAPGASQKASLLLVSEAGETLAFAKIAMAPGADGQIVTAAKWLRELEASPELEQQIPRLLAEGNAANGRRYLVSTLAPTTRSGTFFGPSHAAFLGALGRVAWDITNFAASPCFAYLETTLHNLEPHLTPGERAALQNGLHDCCAYLAGWSGPFVVAHGDFAPWNIRLDGERIFVIDWEHARAGSNPLGDALHFFLMPRITSRRGVTRSAFSATLRQVDRVAQYLYPEWTWRPQVITGLALAYLLEALVRCGAANRGRVGTHPLTADYFRLMEQRAEWVAR